MDRLELNSRTSWTTRFLSILLSGIMLATPFSAVAQLPTNPDLVHGSVDFNQQGASLFMNQSSNAAVVNFDSFSIGAQNGVYITQPGATSALLSRVVGADPSVIHGLLDATGIVYLVNQNGIYFGGELPDRRRRSGCLDPRHQRRQLPGRQEYLRGRLHRLDRQ